MKISIIRLAENFKNFSFHGKELSLFATSYPYNIISGDIYFPSNKGALPVYNVKNDVWDLEEFNEPGNVLTPETRNLHYFMNMYEHGQTFIEDGWGADQHYYIFFNHNELNDFLDLLPIVTSEIINQPILFSEFKLEQVISELYVSVSLEKEIRFIPLDDLVRILPDAFVLKLMDHIFTGNLEFLVDIGSWVDFCKGNNLCIGTNLIGIENVSILFSEMPLSNCHAFLDSSNPYLGIRVKEGFSTQYLFDFLLNSIEGEEFLKLLSSSIINKQLYKKLSITAPKNFISQIKYSMAFRAQYDFYKVEMTKIENHRMESVRDLKDLYKNRRQTANEFLLNAENFKFLDTLKKPLPFNIEKNYRSYLRAGKELDRYHFGGKLYNLILRSIVVYPLEELIRLGFDKTNEEIAEIIETVTSDKPLSDGTWLEIFNRIGAILGKHKGIELSLFGRLVMDIQKNCYGILLSMIPVRNDVAHYRDHSSSLMQLIDKNIPLILDVMRRSLEDCQFILIQGQNQRKDGLYITAKRIMGYEIDIETVEFKTAIDGKQLITDSLVVYNSKCEYIVPLDHYFNVEIVSSETIKMGIIDRFQNGNPVFDF